MQNGTKIGLLCQKKWPQLPTLVLDESQIRQFLVAHFAGEALRVPGGVHGLDHATDDELAWKKIKIGLDELKMLATL